MPEAPRPAPLLAACADAVRGALVALARAGEVPLRERVAAVAEALARAYAAGLALPPVAPVADPPEGAALPLRRVLQAAFGEVDAYAAVFDPYTGTVDGPSGDDEPAPAEAADDERADEEAARDERLADPALEGVAAGDACSLVDDLVVVADALSAALDLLDRGEPEAAHHDWRSALRGHAGRRLTSALYALQTLLSLHLEGVEDEDGA